MLPLALMKSTHVYGSVPFKHSVVRQWRSEGGGQGGGAGPRAQALDGAPAQLVGANFKKKIRPRQISKVT